MTTQVRFTCPRCQREHWVCFDPWGAIAGAQLIECSCKNLYQVQPPAITQLTDVLAQARKIRTDLESATELLVSIAGKGRDADPRWYMADILRWLER